MIALYIFIEGIELYRGKTVYRLCHRCAACYRLLWIVPAILSSPGAVVGSNPFLPPGAPVRLLARGGTTGMNKGRSGKC